MATDALGGILLAVGLYELALAGDALVPSAGRIEAARRAVVVAIDTALERGVPEDEIDALLAQLAARGEDGS